MIKSKLYRRSATGRLPRMLPLALAASGFGPLQTAMAVDHAWTGGDGFWSNAAKWSPVGIPGAGDSAIITVPSSVARLDGDRAVGSLTLGTVTLGGRATLQAGAASIAASSLGIADATEGRLVIDGPASFAGASVANLRYGQIVELRGSTTWSAGNGRIEVQPGYGGSASDDPYRRSQLIIGPGTTFTDAGAAAAAGVKYIGYDGGEVVNLGTYVRQGSGTTVASYGFDNRGTVRIDGGTFDLTGGTARSRSSGEIRVAAGTTLRLGAADITGGRIDNAGRVLLASNALTDVSAGATIGGRWEIALSTAELRLAGTHAIGHLEFTSGYLGGRTELGASSANFGAAVFGRADATEGRLVIDGPASFAGASVANLRYGQIVELRGNTTWSVGNGRIEVQPGDAGSATTDPYRRSQLIIGAGTTFTDAGAAAAAGTKYIGYRGGEVVNLGTYVRQGSGTTEASYGFDNRGTVRIDSGTFDLTGGTARSRSSGEIRVAAGTTLRLGAADITGGRIDNAGRVLLASNALTDVSAGATIGGRWEIALSTAELRLAGTHAIGHLEFTSGYLGGRTELGASSANFGAAVFGRADATEGRLVIDGPASFAGASVANLRYGQIVELRGNTTWSVGNGRIEVQPGDAGSATTDPYRRSQLIIGAGTTFTDAGAAAAAGTKYIGYRGGEVVNLGTYVRQGAGATHALGGFRNAGTVHIASGRLQADRHFRNEGALIVDAGAVFATGDPGFTNHGALQGTGQVETHGTSDALVNLGRIRPGTAGGVGMLGFTGDLTLDGLGFLDIDLVGLAMNDRIVVSSDLRAGGTLALWAAGYLPQAGDSFVIASYTALTPASRFDQILWNGAMGAGLFVVDYGATEAILRVSAVPEPGPWALMLGGAALLTAWRRRSQA